MFHDEYTTTKFVIQDTEDSSYLAHLDGEWGPEWVCQDTLEDAALFSTHSNANRALLEYTGNPLRYKIVPIKVVLMVRTQETS